MQTFHRCPKHDRPCASCYSHHGCRCEGCRHDHTRAHKLWRHRRETGRRGLVDGTGTARRLQALVLRGFSRRMLSLETGLGETQIGRLLSPESPVLLSTALVVAAAYDRLWDKTPVGSAAHIARTRVHAENLGYVPGLAWDDDRGPHGIDNPQATPRVGRVDARSKFDLADLELLVSENYNVDQIAERLGVSPDAVLARVRRSLDGSALHKLQKA